MPPPRQGQQHVSPGQRQRELREHCRRPGYGFRCFLALKGNAVKDSGSQALPGNPVYCRLCLLSGGGASTAVRSQAEPGTERCADSPGKKSFTALPYRGEI